MSRGRLARGARWLGLAALGVGGASVAAALAIRASHRRQIDRCWNSLALNGTGERFDPDSVSSLPVAARRYLLHSIAPGTPLAGRVELELRGHLRLDQDCEGMPWSGREIIATPHGFLWTATARRGPASMTGFDYFAFGEGGMRWWLWGLLPLANASDADTTRSAAGRTALEAIWFPPALLPSTGVTWEEIDETTARAHLDIYGEPCALELTVDAEGRLRQVQMQRWALEGDDGKPGYLLWRGDQILSEESFGGYTIPTLVRVTRAVGTEMESAFFEAEVLDATFL